MNTRIIEEKILELWSYLDTTQRENLNILLEKMNSNINYIYDKLYENVDLDYIPTTYIYYMIIFMLIIYVTNKTLKTYHFIKKVILLFSFTGIALENLIVLVKIINRYLY
jgi:hypothetical protein